MNDQKPIEAGPAIDVLVAEKVMGFHWETDTSDDPGYDGRRTLWWPKKDSGANQSLDDGPYACVWKSGELSIFLCDRPILPAYSSSIIWALTIIHEMRRRGFDFKMEQSGAHHYQGSNGRSTVFNEKTRVSFTCHNAICGEEKGPGVDWHGAAGGNGHGAELVEAATAPLAICRAALKAVGA